MPYVCLLGAHSQICLVVSCGVLYCVVACCEQCGKVGAWERAKSIIVDMRAEGISPTVFTYSSLINAYSKVGTRREPCIGGISCELVLRTYVGQREIRFPCNRGSVSFQGV